MSVTKDVVVSVTETTGAGVYTANVSVPAGAYLKEVAVQQDAQWTATTSATGIVGDVADDNGIFDALDMKAMAVGATVSAAGGTNTAGGKAGADIAATAWNRRSLTTARVITLKITTVGAAGNAGRSRLLVSYTTTGSGVVAAATKA